MEHPGHSRSPLGFEMDTSHFVTIERIQRVVDAIVRIAQPDKILVFGSCCRHNMKWDSDLDLFIEMDTDLPFSDRALAIRNLFEEVPYPLDIVVHTPEEVARWREVPSSFVHKIFAEGRVVYDRFAKASGQPVDAALRGNIEAVCHSKGFEVPIICTPEELLEV